MSYARFVSAMGVLLVAGVLATPVLGQEAMPPPVSHDVQGRDNCLMCHTPGAMEAVPDAPATHEGRGIETCLWCHAKDSPMLTTSPKPASHGVQGREQGVRTIDSTDTAFGAQQVCICLFKFRDCAPTAPEPVSTAQDGYDVFLCGSVPDRPLGEGLGPDGLAPCNGQFSGSPSPPGVGRGHP